MNDKVKKKMKPRIFISSTFYDLKYIREELMRFIVSKNYEPILFENGNVGYTPNRALDISCYEAMKNSDMAILIIGGKYGSPSTTDNNEFEEYVSVTRKEFRSANESKIPIYTFVDSKVFTEYELYERNINESEAILNIKFNNADNINIFKFINEIKILGLPMFQFLTINDIEHILNEQWADLMKKYLTQLREQKTAETLQDILEKLENTIGGIDNKVTLVSNKLYDGKHDDFDNELTVLTLSNRIKANIRIFENKSYSKEENIKMLFDALIYAFSFISKVKDISSKEFSDIIDNSLKHKNIQFCNLNHDLRRNADLFNAVANNTKLYNDVLSKLMENYDVLVRQ